MIIVQLTMKEKGKNIEHPITWSFKDPESAIHAVMKGGKAISKHREQTQPHPSLPKGTKR